jgi:hypothetical protein
MVTPRKYLLKATLINRVICAAPVVTPNAAADLPDFGAADPN